MAKHTCRFTSIAPEASEEIANQPFIAEPHAIWEWCIECGKLRLGKLTFTPGPKQKKCLLADQE